MAKNNTEEDIEKNKLRDAIRKRPGMYVGNRNGAVEHLIEELVVNAIDLHLAGQATQLSVITEGDFIEVSDDGPGFPFDAESPIEGVSFAEYVLTNFHSSPTADNHAPHVHMKLRGLGLVVVWALSTWFEVESCKNGKSWRIAFKSGARDGQIHCSPTNKPNGTRIRFIPDQEILNSKSPRREILRSKLFESVHLYPGLKVHFNDEIFHAPGGLKDIISFYSKQTAHDHHIYIDPFYFNIKTDLFSLQVSILGGESSNCEIRSWANGIVTVLGGSHVEGVQTALKNVNWEPNAVLVNYIAYDVQFAGPTKDQLINPEIISTISELLIPPLKEYLAQIER